MSIDVNISVSDELVGGASGGDVGGVPVVIGGIVDLLGGVALVGGEWVGWVVGEAEYNKGYSLL